MWMPEMFGFDQDGTGPAPIFIDDHMQAAFLESGALSPMDDGENSSAGSLDFSGFDIPNGNSDNTKQAQHKSGHHTRGPFPGQVNGVTFQDIPGFIDIEKNDTRTKAPKGAHFDQSDAIRRGYWSLPTQGLQEDHFRVFNNADAHADFSQPRWRGLSESPTFLASHKQQQQPLDLSPTIPSQGMGNIDLQNHNFEDLVLLPPHTNHQQSSGSTAQPKQPTAAKNSPKEAAPGINVRQSDTKAAAKGPRATKALTDNKSSQPRLHRTISQNSEEYINGADDEVDPETYTVRTHPLYIREPEDDGCYHCPYMTRENCNHPPTRLKCNYDKYIDSHLKPHRCKAPECKDLRFSSPACRLRHEREAHGSHGHGVKPFLCEYPDCERARPGMGFPRSWNCKDHMRRVHDRSPSPPAERLESPTEEVPSESNAQANKRRKSTEVEGKQPGKKQKAGEKRIEPESCKQSRKISQKELLLQQWRHQYSIVHKRVHEIKTSSDPAAVEQLHRDAGLLSAMSKRLTEFA